jgi:hypothetical protein
MYYASPAYGSEVYPICGMFVHIYGICAGFEDERICSVCSGYFST